MRRRIALISEHASPLAVLGGVDAGGQNVYVAQLAKALAAIGYEVDVLTRRDSPILPEAAEWVTGVRIVHVPAGPPEPVAKEELLPYMEEFAGWVVRHARRQRRPYDLVHANFWLSGLVACELKRALGLPFVVTFHALGRVRRQHQGDADRFPDERFAVEDRIVAAADRLLAECPQDEEDLIRLYNADPSRISLVPCGFDPTELWPMSKELARAALGFAPDERVVLQLGRLVPRKGVDTAIGGFARLVREHGIEARLLVGGGEVERPDPRSSPELARLARVARAAGVADAVDFLGRVPRDRLKVLYSAADVFVTVPWYEPFGITPVEAMACGTPVVGANVGGIKFTVRDGETGYLVPPRDERALGDRLAHLYRHPKLIGVRSRQAVRRAQDLFTWERIARTAAGVYEDVLARAPATCAEPVCGQALVERRFGESIAALETARARLAGPVADAAAALAECFERGGKALVCGNGGSAADGQHLVGELVGRFRRPERRALPAIALTADGTVLTAWANDAGYADVFARQVDALGRPGDVLVAISTSGRSPNVLAALTRAKAGRLRTIALLGGDGGEARRLADVAILAPGGETARIQEVHGVVVHLVCELVEESLAGALSAPARVVPRAAPRGRRSGPRRERRRG
ncbi:MAG: glycosyltransferase [Thermoleophilia bacterium]